MSLNCGIVGLPNVGKSTIFNAITKAGAEMANYPFCTIEPNKGIVEVPDERLNLLESVHKPRKVIPAIIEFVDIAGLVKGANKGEGLGNQFLSHIREVDAICHVVRAFEDENITHVHGSINPEEDISVINYELILADYESLEKQYIRISKNAKSGNKESIEHLPVVEKIIDALGKGISARLVELNVDEKKIAKRFNLITLKPVLYCANVADTDVKTGNKYTERIQKIASSENAEMVILSGKIEQEISNLDREEQIEFLKELGLEESGLTRMVISAYKLLSLITYFTAGEQEVRAWTIQDGFTAPKAASVIHSDFEKGFIRAEVMSYTDIERLKDPQKVKEEGKLRLEGKEYIVKDGDVIFFRVNA